LVDGLKQNRKSFSLPPKAEYAMKRLIDATDYLQKPIAIDRFNASVKELNEIYQLRK
jgi:uncharacterized protein (DUF1810 family)